MSDLQRSIQLNKHTTNSCLEINIQTLKEITENQNFQHIIKYKLSSSIQGSPTWHRSQL
jgi:hypothetical protein